MQQRHPAVQLIQDHGPDLPPLCADDLDLAFAQPDRRNEIDDHGRENRDHHPVQDGVQRYDNELNEHDREIERPERHRNGYIEELVQDQGRNVRAARTCSYPDDTADAGAEHDGTADDRKPRIVRRDGLTVRGNINVIDVSKQTHKGRVQQCAGKRGERKLFSEQDRAQHKEYDVCGIDRERDKPFVLFVHKISHKDAEPRRPAHYKAVRNDKQRTCGGSGGISHHDDQTVHQKALYLPSGRFFPLQFHRSLRSPQSVRCYYSTEPARKQVFL